MLNTQNMLIIKDWRNVAQSVDSALVILYWKVGQKIQQNILDEKRAGYEKEIVHALSAGGIEGDFHPTLGLDFD